MKIMFPISFLTSFLTIFSQHTTSASLAALHSNVERLELAFNESSKKELTTKVHQPDSSLIINAILLNRVQYKASFLDTARVMRFVGDKVYDLGGIRGITFEDLSDIYNKNFCLIMNFYCLMRKTIKGEDYIENIPALLVGASDETLIKNQKEYGKLFNIRSY